MKQTAQFLIGLTIFALLPAFVENVAQLDILGPILGMTVGLTVLAAVIFAWPAKTPR